MDIQTLTSLIGSLGFPIVMCFLMSYYIVQTMGKFIEVAQNVENTVQQNKDALEKNKELLEDIENLIMKLESELTNSKCQRTESQTPKF